MATRTVSNAGGNWNAPATWTLGVVPIAGDDIAFTATSGNLTVNVNTANLVGVNFTNYVGTITGWNIVSDISGSCVIDVWKAAGVVPTVANTIAGTEKPTLSSQQLNSDNALTTWTTAVTAGDVIGFNLDSASTLTSVNLIITILKS